MGPGSGAINRLEAVAIGPRFGGLVPILSLFSGAGVLDYAFESTGHFATACAIEIEPDFADTILRNKSLGVVSTRDVLCADLSTLNPKSIVAEHIGNCRPFGVIGGPPCQSFSSMGSKRGVEDGRGQLMFEFVRWVRDTSPDFFLIENVPNFEKIDGGGPFRELLTLLETLDYRVSAAVLNAADYGSPTVRRRLLIVGTRACGPFKFPSKTHSSVATSCIEPLLPWVSVLSALSGLPSPSDDPGRRPQWHVRINHTDAVRARFSDIAPGGYDYIRKRSRLAPNVPSVSLVAGDARGARFHIHPREPREITNREAARIQGIPDDFHFAGKRVAVARQIANAVPVPLGKAIAEEIFKQLNWTAGHGADI